MKRCNKNTIAAISEYKIIKHQKVCCHDISVEYLYKQMFKNE